MKLLGRVKEYLLVRVKNKGFWVSLCALVPLFLQCFFDTNILPENYQQITDTALSVLVVLGIISNPKDGKWYVDDKYGDGLSDEDRVSKAIDSIESMAIKKVSNMDNLQISKEVADRLIDDLAVSLKEALLKKSQNK